MRGMPYNQAVKSSDSGEITNRYVREALAKQAALRPARTPPKELPVTPTLPRMRKVKRRRRSA
jgi:hypothetical protein